MPPIVARLTQRPLACENGDARSHLSYIRCGRLLANMGIPMYEISSLSIVERD